jgi:toxin ParE1/3/4
MKNEVAYKLTQIAEIDLQNLKYYSKHAFGEKRTIEYIRSIHEKCLKIAALPHLGFKRDDIRSDLRSAICESHVIFYKRLENEILIFRILHKSMDIEMNLKLVDLETM